MANQYHRIEWIDIARGIAILLMVAGHTSIPQYLSKYIWSFHMPLFFLVSGIFFNPQKYGSFGVLLTKRLLTLIIPYWFFTFIVFFGYYGTEYFKPYELYYGWEGYALWFIPVLFIAEMIFYPISKLKLVNIIIVTLILTIFGKILSFYGVKFPFKMDCVPFALFFISSGFITKKYIISFQPTVYIVILLGITTIGLSQVLPKLDMARNEFGLVVPNLFNALIGIYFIFCISKYISHWSKLFPIRFIDYFGRNSLFVMAFSQLYNYWILVELNKFEISGIYGLLLRYVILFTAIYVSSKLLIKYTPFLVGKINYEANESK